MSTLFPVLCLLISISYVSACNAQPLRHAGAVEFVKSNGQTTYRRKDPQLVIYTRQLTPNVLRLARVVEEVASKHVAIRCFLIVTHENDPAPSQQDWDGQFAELNRMVKQHQDEFRHMSFALWRRFPLEADKTRAFRNYSRFGDGNVAIELIRKRSDSKSKIMTQYSEVLKSDQLDAGTLHGIAQQLTRMTAGIPATAVPAHTRHDLTK